MEFIVYAAGPIAAVDYAGASGWREKLQVDFDGLVQTGDRIRVASPMRGKDYFKETTGEIGAYYDHTALDNRSNGGELVNTEYRRCLSSPEAIMVRDFNDCSRANLVFVNFLGAKRISAGTIMEIAWAFARRTPVVCCMEKDSVYRHPMVDMACNIVTEDYDVAVKVAANILLPNVQGIGEVRAPWLMGGTLMGPYVAPNPYECIPFPPPLTFPNIAPTIFPNSNTSCPVIVRDDRHELTTG